MKVGLALVPEDRRKQGLVMDATVASNVTDAIRPDPHEVRTDHHAA